MSRSSVQKIFCRPNKVSEHNRMLITVGTAEVSRHICSLQKFYSIEFDIERQPRNTENRKIIAKKLPGKKLKLVSSNIDCTSLT